MPNLHYHLLAAALCVCHAAWAGNPPAPAGVYPLKPGIYVAEGSQCEDPANAAIRRYNGEGIDTAHTRACRAVVHPRGHGAYAVEQSCIDSGAGPGERFTERQRVVVHDPSTFVQTIGRDGTTYHYCPASRLPADLRDAAR